LVEHLVADALGLVEPVNAVHQGVVVGVAGTADRRLNAMQDWAFRELNGSILYLCTIMGVWSNRIVGYSLARLNMNATLAVRALHSAI